MNDSPDMIKRMVPKARQLRVCVVGAGVSGLRAADVLTQHGAHVTIYEARDRVGGRVGQSNHLGHLVDTGPNWIHGTDHNPILTLAEKTKTTLHSWPERQVVFDEDGTRIPDAEVAEIAEGFWGIVSDAFQYSNDNTDTCPPERSLMDFVLEKVDDKFTDESKEVAKTKRRRLVREAEMWGAFVGSPTQTQSLKFFWLEECIEGENPFVAGTYQKILQEIARPAQERAEIKLNQRVKAVSTQAEKEGNVSIEADGKIEEYDEVIVTSTLGWLQQNKDSFFDPPLPSTLSDAIMNVGYGTLDKVYITFPTAFWDKIDQKAGGDVSMKQDDAPNTTATTAPHRQSNSSEGDEHYPGFTLFYSNRDYTKPDPWIQQGMNLAALPEDCAHPTILFYIFGDCSKEIAKLVEDAPADTLDEKLIDYFKPYFSLLPNYSKDDPVCKAKAAFATNWASDELAGYGSYSTFRTGLEAGDKDIECMRHGMPERHVWLAGEHTAPFAALGTVTGAYWSGEAVAKRIVEAYGLTDVK